MEKKKMAIYPFNNECIVFSEFVNEISDKYIFCEAAAPRSWYYSSKKINTSKGEYTVKNSIRDFEQKCDVLLIPDFGELFFAEESIAKEICKHTDKFSEIISDAYFSEDSIMMIEEKCKATGCTFRNLKNISDNIKLPEISQYICRNNVPIIAVAGTWDNTDKFFVQLQLKRKLETIGYKVSLIASREYAELFGAHRFPEFMLCQHQPENIKPVVFSEYIHKLEETEKPDVIIVGVPGPIHSLSEKVTKGFGILPYITFQSICPDFFIYCSLLFDKKEIMEDEGMLCAYRLGVYPDIVHVSRLSVKIDEQASSAGYVKTRKDKEPVNRIIDEINSSKKIVAIDLTDNECIDMMMETIENKLCHEQWSVV